MTGIVEKNIAGVDLNLLVAFEALLEERHVTRAGQRIGLAQPSMSSALTRLRALFGDELFRRTAGGMIPTSRALDLAGPVGEALRHVRRALEEETPFDPSTSQHRFRLATTDYGDLIVVPPLVQALRAQAPGINLQVRPLTDAMATMEQLEHGEIDAMLGGHLPLPRNGLRQQLFDERFVCIRAAGQASSHAMLDLAGYAALPHALFSASGGDGAPTALDAVLAEQGFRRRIVVTLPHVAAVPFAVAGTDLAAALAERVAWHFRSVADVVVLPLPISLPPFGVDLLYTTHSTSTAAGRWFVSLLLKIGKRIGEATRNNDWSNAQSRQVPVHIE